MTECPPGYRLYAPVLSRLGADFRRQGGGLTFRCPFGSRHRAGEDRHPSAFLKIGRLGELVAYCNGCQADWRLFVALVGLPASAWWPRSLRQVMSDEAKQPKPQPVAEYPYRDRQGVLQAVKVRLEPGFDGRPKSFAWRRPVPDGMRRKFELPAGKTAWVSGPDCLKSGWYARVREVGGVVYFGIVHDRQDSQCYQLPAVNPGLYRLPELLAAPVASPVLVVEGEGKADLLASLGFVATSGPSGKGKWEPGWASDFAGRRVVAIPDRDAADSAMDYGHAIVASAIYYRCASVRLVELPVAELKPGMAGGDIKDWLARRFPDATAKVEEKRAAVAELCKAFAEWKPSPNLAAKAA